MLNGSYGPDQINGTNGTSQTQIEFIFHAKPTFFFVKLLHKYILGLFARKSPTLIVFLTIVTDQEPGLHRVNFWVVSVGSSCPWRGPILKVCGLSERQRTLFVFDSIEVRRLVLPFGFNHSKKMSPIEPKVAVLLHDQSSVRTH